VMRDRGVPGAWAVRDPSAVRSMCLPVGHL
jgi:hypothetical protein